MQATYEVRKPIYYNDRFYNRGEQITVHARTIMPSEFVKISGKEMESEEAKETAVRIAEEKEVEESKKADR